MDDVESNIDADTNSILIHTVFTIMQTNVEGIIDSLDARLYFDVIEWEDVIIDTDNRSFSVRIYVFCKESVADDVFDDHEILTEQLHNKMNKIFYDKGFEVKFVVDLKEEYTEPKYVDYYTTAFIINIKDIMIAMETEGGYESWMM